MLFFPVFDLKFSCNYQYAINIRNYLISNVHELDEYAALHDDKDRGDDNADHDGLANDTNTDEDRDYYYDSGCCNDNDGYTHSIVGGDANTGVDHIADNDDIDG